MFENYRRLCSSGPPSQRTPLWSFRMAPVGIRFLSRQMRAWSCVSPHRSSSDLISTSSSCSHRQWSFSATIDRWRPRPPQNCSLPQCNRPGLRMKCRMGRICNRRCGEPRWWATGWSRGAWPRNSMRCPLFHWIPVFHF